VLRETRARVRAGRVEEEGDDGFVAFAVTGDRTPGAYHCAGCGYGVTIQETLPRCPMCAGTVWEPATWSTFTPLQ
jgi:rubredoxin